MSFLKHYVKSLTMVRRSSRRQSGLKPEYEGNNNIQKKTVFTEMTRKEQDVVMRQVGIRYIPFETTVEEDIRNEDRKVCHDRCAAASVPVPKQRHHFIAEGVATVTETWKIFESKCLKHLACTICCQPLCVEIEKKDLQSACTPNVVPKYFGYGYFDEAIHAAYPILRGDEN